MSRRAVHYYHDLCSQVGLAAQTASYASVARRFGVTVAFVKYWANKHADPNFHPGELGGTRNVVFVGWAQLFVELVLWELVSTCCST
jgi:hypothetical protein